MFAYLNGKVTYKEPTAVIIDINGVGYSVRIPLSTFQSLPDQGRSVKLYIHHHVREDDQALFGFATQEEKELFLMLINISGIGPKMAITMLSGATPQEFRNRIITNDVKALTLIPGVGKKTAQRIIMELKEKLSAVEAEMELDTSAAQIPIINEEALKALLSLGYKRSESLRALKRAYTEVGENGNLEKYLKVALNKI